MHARTLNDITGDSFIRQNHITLPRTCAGAAWKVRSSHLCVIAVLMFCLASAGTCLAQSTPMHEWNLRPQNVAAGNVKAAIGSADGMVIGNVKHSSTTPHGLMFDGNSKARHQVSITDNIATIALPKQDISVEAWVLVDKPLEWGGICSLIQDNGDFERGCILGYRKSSFCFGIASEGRRKLTYLTSNQSFEFGFWYHVVGTYDGAVMNLYVDGKRTATSKEQSGNIAYPPSAKLSLGCYIDDDECHAMTGQIERVSLFDSSLAAVEVESRFEARKSEFPGITAVVPEVTDWPTYRRDTQRTGRSSAELQFPMHLQWVHHSQHAPAPAWPAPAVHDFWNRKHNLQPRVTFDRAFHSVCVGDRLYFGSSADDKVYCLDATTGKQLWAFFTEGPVRLAPTIAEDKLLFGSDDGFVYCLNSATGKLIWKYRHDANGADRRIPGNERMIAAMPVRSGVLVEDDVAYFSAGIFPNQGVYQVAVDVNTGQPLGSGKLNVSAQGYLERRSGKLYVPAARDPAGAFATELVRRGKGVGQDANQFADEYPYSFISARNVRIAGGDGEIAAINANDGSKLWTASVEGRAYGLSIAGGRLFVNTDQGLTYCFGLQQVDHAAIVAIETSPFRFANEKQAAKQVTKAQRILTESNVQKGYCLVLNSGDGSLAYELARQSELSVVAVEADIQRVNESRAAIGAAGFYGAQVVVHHLPSADALPYTDYVFNLVVDAAAGGGAGVDVASVDRAEVLRVLRPGTGIAWLGKAGGTAGDSDNSVIRRPKLDRTGEWSHMYADVSNTSCSTDERVKGPMAMQWFGKPGPREMLNRHHRTVAPLWKNGRLFIPGNDQIFAADAYNGTLLWNVKLPESRRIAAFRDCSYMSASDDHLFAVAGDECHVLNAQTGYAEHVFQVPQKSDRTNSDWGYVANVKNLLVGSGCRTGASRREHTRDSIMEAAYFDEQYVVCSDYLFAFDHVTTGRQWVYEAKTGAIVNSTITIGDGTVFFIESQNVKTLDTENGRNKPVTLLAGGASLVAIDLQTGNEKWRVDSATTKVQHNLYVAYSSSNVITVGSRNSGTDKTTARVVYDIEAVDGATGKRIWQQEQMQQTKIGGDHGEQDLHPVIVGNTLYCEPMAYDVATGKPQEWGWKLGKRSGCGNISASASTFFFRQSNPTAFDLDSKTVSPVTTATRPGCLINIIPAGGLLLIPEASSGCTCDYGVQTSLAFLPMGE